MKKSLKKLKFNKEVISKLNSDSIKGGGLTLFCGGGMSLVSCMGGFCGNSVPRGQGGIGCHIK